MTLAQEPMGNLLINLYKKADKNAEDILVEKAENLVDIIRSRINKGISYTCESLLDEVFDMRIEMMNYFKNFKAILSGVQDITIQNIAEEDVRGRSNYGDSLELFYKITSGAQELINQNPQMSMAAEGEIAKVSYRSLMQLFREVFPIRNFDIIEKYLSASLQFECAFMIKVLADAGELQLSETQYSELFKKLNSSITSYAFYSAILGYWTPDEEDETDLVRNVKILLAEYELRNNGNAQGLTLDEVKKRLLN